MPSRFLFHASAIGITGQITRPVTHPIPSVASALPPGGGYTNARQEPGQLLEIYSHGGATTAATGNEKNGDHETTATATVLDLNIGNVVLLDSCTAYLSSIHPGDGSQARFNTQGSFFKNLRIAGREIELESRVDLHVQEQVKDGIRVRVDMLATLDQLKEHYKDDVFREQFLKDAFAGKEGTLHPKQHKYFPWRKWTNSKDLPVSKGGVCIIPLFVVKNPSEPGFHVCGNVITVDNFGTVVLGELIIGAYERRLTMLHAELGSPVGGMVSAAAVQGNGGGVDP